MTERYELLITKVDGRGVVTGYEGLHGPASIQYGTGFLETEVAGPELPTARLAAGPGVADNPSFQAGNAFQFSGSVDDLPFAASQEDRRYGPKRPVRLVSDEWQYTVRALGIIGTPVLTRPDGFELQSRANLMRSLGFSRRLTWTTSDVTPLEVVLMLTTRASRLHARAVRHAWWML